MGLGGERGAYRLRAVKRAALVGVCNVVILGKVDGSNIDGRLCPDLLGGHVVVPPPQSIQGTGQSHNVF